MKQMNLFLLCFLVFCYSTFGQIDIPKIKNKKPDKTLVIDSLIKDLINKSKVTIMFRRYSVWKFDIDYNIISYGNDSIWHYNYFTDAPIKKIFDISIPEDTIKLVWNNCIQNNLFSLNSENKSHNKCNNMILDSHHYEFIITKNGGYKKIEYYDPEFFEKECQSSKERINIINCAKSFLTYCYTH
jgi:hypothetical protein